MIVRRNQRRVRRGGERGVTLIELLVTIAIMGVGFLALLSAFATIERQTGSTADNAQLVTVAREVADAIETQPSQAGSVAVAYVLCTNPNGSDYQTKLNALPLGAAPDTIMVTAAAQAVGSTSSHVVSSVSQPLTPISNCGNGTSSPVPDYGVQQITFKVSSPSGHSVVRTVYKRWN